MTIRTDAFTRADGSIGSSAEGWSWTETLTAFYVESNAARAEHSGFTSLARCNGDLGGTAHYSQVSVANTAKTVGATVRCGDSNDDCFMGFWNSPANRWELYSRISGAWSLLGDDVGVGAPALNDLIRLEANGTTITLKQNGTQRVQVTSSSLSANTKAGISAQNGGKVDNFIAALLSDPDPSSSPSSTPSSSPSASGGSTSPSSSPSSSHSSSPSPTGPPTVDPPAYPNAYMVPDRESTAGWNIYLPTTAEALQDLLAGLTPMVRPAVIKLDPALNYDRSEYIISSNLADDGQNWVYIQPTDDAYAQLPAEHTRITPAYLPYMPSLRATGFQKRALKIHYGKGLTRVRFIGLDFTKTDTQLTASIVDTARNDDETVPNALSQFPQYLIFDQCIVRGNATNFGTFQREGITLNAHDSAMVECDVYDIRAGTQESKALWIHQAARRLTIENCRFFGVSSCVFFGGTEAKIANELPEDIDIIRCLLDEDPKFDSTSTSYVGGSWTFKNKFEIKYGKRIRLEGCVIKGLYGVGGGQGQALVLKCSDQTSGAQPWLETSDLIIQNNHITDVPGGVYIGMASDLDFDTKTGKRWLIHNNFIHHKNRQSFAFNEYGVGFGGGFPASPDVYSGTDLKITHNTMVGRSDGTMGTTLNGFHLIYLNDLVDRCNDVIYRDNIGFNEYAVVWRNAGATGDTAIAAENLLYDFANNLTVGSGNPATAPASWYVEANIANVLFSNPAGGNWSLQISSPYAAGNAKDATDGQDMGVMWNTLNAAIANTLSGIRVPMAGVTPSHSASATPSGSASPCSSQSVSASSSPSSTASSSQSGSASSSASSSQSSSGSSSGSSSASSSRSSSPSGSPSSTASSSQSSSQSPSSSPSSSASSSASASAPIVGTLSITGPSTVTEGELTTDYTITCDLTAISPITIQLLYTGTATNGLDYDGVPTAVIAIDDTTVTFAIQTFTAGGIEGSETMIVGFGNVSGGDFDSVMHNGSSVTTTIQEEAGVTLPMNLLVTVQVTNVDRREVTGKQNVEITTSGSHEDGRVVSVATSETSFVMDANVGNSGLVYLLNLDDTNFVRLGFATGVYYIRLDPGVPQLLQLVPTVGTLYLIADTAACEVQLLAYEA